MNKDLEKYSLSELQELRKDIDEIILKKENNENSWNSKISVEEFCLDYELKQKLISMGITNMKEFKENGYHGIPESLQEKAEFTMKMFDFDNLEKQYKK